MIRPGDLLHCDVGFKYMRLLTDHQEMAYVLAPAKLSRPKGCETESGRRTSCRTFSPARGRKG